jgi:hypothetical protein
MKTDVLAVNDDGTVLVQDRWELGAGIMTLNGHDMPVKEVALLFKPRKEVLLEGEKDVAH